MDKVEKNKLTTHLFLFLLPFLLLTVGCNTNKYLKSDESLVKKNNINIISDKKIKNKRGLKYELSTLVKQKKNKKTLGVARARLWAYNKVQDPGDTTKWYRWVRRVIAEPPTLYNQEITEATANSMRYYLQQKGYNDAVVIDTVVHKRKRKRSIVTYNAYLNNIYKIDSVFFISQDSKVKRILFDNSKETLLKRGEPVSKGLFDKENERITSVLQNTGYAYFNNSYFYAEGDTNNYKVNVFYEVLLPPKGEEHQIYSIGNITVIPDYDPFLPSPKQDTIIDGIRFLKRTSILKVKSNNIVNNIFLKSGEIYQEKNYVKTNLQLGALDIYKRVNIQSDLDSIDSNKLNFTIRLSAKKRMEFGADLELNNSTYNSGNQNSLLGFAGSLNFRHRNLFRNAYLFLAKIQGGVDLDIGNPSQLLYSVDMKAQVDLYMPRFVDPIKIFRGLKNVGLLNSNFYTDLQEKGRTRFSASYNYLSLFQFYAYNSTNFSYGYDLQRNSRNRYEINPFGINYLQTSKEQAFIDIIDKNPFLKNSFDDQLFTGLFFKDFTYTYLGRTNKYGSSWFFSGNLELSGAEVLAANSIYNGIASDDVTFQLFNRVDFAQFASIILDGRYYKKTSPNQSFAARLLAGVAIPFGNTKEVPYVKQFYTGGPTSIRAWRIRELGPGQFLDPNTLPGADTIPFYQTGDLRLEFNAEYRFDIFWMLEGAIFLDAGNVWLIKEDSSREGSQFLFKAKKRTDGTIVNDHFLKQMAIGTGFGIRADFSYFIIRFDMGLKLRTPYPDDNNNNKYWRWNKLFKRGNGFNYNLAIGYPF